MLTKKCLDSLKNINNLIKTTPEHAFKLLIFHTQKQGATW
jgi:hypothetical protein